jgi:hypothetical protein
MNTLPAPSTATPCGDASHAAVPAIPSPLYPFTPSPAIVEMSPVPASTRRMRLLPRSAINTLPPASTATPYGWFNLAVVAAIPSLTNPALPFPAIVEIMPVAALILRTR